MRPVLGPVDVQLALAVDGVGDLAAGPRGAREDALHHLRGRHQRLELTDHLPPAAHRDGELAAEQALETLGALSITLQDDADDPVLEPGPGQTPLWPTV